MHKTDFSKIRVPYLNSNQIDNKAKEFRKKYWDGVLPVDIEKIIDVKLEIDIIPVPGLEEVCNANALISSDWSSLYADKKIFEDERRYNRLRYSLAHEIGHFILHKNLYSGLKIKSFEDFYEFLEKIPPEQYGYLETQANKFAGYLLVPRKMLEQEIIKFISQNGLKDTLNEFEEKMLKSNFANPLSKIFGISQESMEIILNEFEIKKYLI